MTPIERLHSEHEAYKQSYASGIADERNRIMGILEDTTDGVSPIGLVRPVINDATNRILHDNMTQSPPKRTWTHETDISAD
jgi:hypothetical protein